MDNCCCPCSLRRWIMLPISQMRERASFSQPPSASTERRKKFTLPFFFRGTHFSAVRNLAWVTGNLRCVLHDCCLQRWNDCYVEGRNHSSLQQGWWCQLVSTGLHCSRWLLVKRHSWRGCREVGRGVQFAHGDRWRGHRQVIISSSSEARWWGRENRDCEAELGAHTESRWRARSDVLDGIPVVLLVWSCL